MTRERGKQECSREKVLVNFAPDWANVDVTTILSAPPNPSLVNNQSHAIFQSKRCGLGGGEGIVKAKVSSLYHAKPYTRLEVKEAYIPKKKETLF